MQASDLRRLRRQLERFVEHCFTGMGRAERRDALGHYVRGLLLDGERKSMVPIAARLAERPDDVGAVRQRLQQAVAVASWDEFELYQRIAGRVLSTVPNVEALVLDDTGFPKKGHHSVGVQRQYSGTMGRIDNCQVATSLHLASDHGGACIGMRLYLPQKWAESNERRAKAGVPDEVGFKKKWQLGIDLVDKARGWRLKQLPSIVVADAGFGDAREFRKELENRGFEYIVGVAGTHSVWPPGVIPNPPKAHAPGRPGRPRTKWTPPRAKKPQTILSLAKSLPSSAYRRVTWGEGTRGKQWSRFAFLRVRPAPARQLSRPPESEQWLICEWPKRAEHPTTFYLSSLPAKTAKRRLIYLAKLRWRIERDYQEMKGELGLDHFEGRGWTGFHHHVACVAAAHAFLTIHRVLFPPQHPDISDLSEDPSDGADQTHWTLPDVSPEGVSAFATKSVLAQVIK